MKIIAAVVLSALATALVSSPVAAFTFSDGRPPYVAASGAHAGLVRQCLARPERDRLQCFAQVVEPFDAVVVQLLSNSD